MRKKLFPLLLAVAASVGTMFAWDYEQVEIDDLYYNLDATNHTAEVTYTYYRYSGDIIIPASVTYNEITYTVTSIREKAFQGCSSLTSVTIPSSVASIGDGAFNGCSNLTTITNFATTPQPLDPDGISVFGGVPLACTLYVPAESVDAYQAADVWKEFGNIFAIDSTEEAEVLSIGEAIQIGMALDSMATSTETYTIEGYVINAGTFNSGAKYQNWYMADYQETASSDFQAYKCYPIDGIDTVEVRNGSKVRMTGHLQKYYDRQKALYVVEMTYTPAIILSKPQIDTITVAEALALGAELEDNASTGKQYTIRGYVSSVTTPFSEQYLNQTFYIADDSLSTASSNEQGGFYVYRGKPTTGQAIREGALVELTTAILNYNGMIIENAKQNVPVTVLQEVLECRVFSGTCGENVTWTFNNCDSVLTISGTGAMADYNDYHEAPWDSYRYSCNMTVVIEEGVTYIGKNAFAYYGRMKNVTIPSSVLEIGKDAFISSATAFNVDEANPNYSSIDGVLFNKGQTTLLYYPTRKTDTHYTIPSTVNTISNGAFYSADYLTSLDIPNTVITIEGSAFRYCIALKSVSFPNSVLTIGYDAFEYCDNLVTANISSSVTSIGNHAFAGCKKLQSINVDETNFYYCSIDGVLFNKDQTKLLQYPNGKEDTLYIIPNMVTTLGNMSFSYILKQDSVKLTSIVIPSSVTTINANAFWDANDLASITNYAVTPQWVSAPYAHISSCTLYVPAQSLEAYQAADFWKDFANILPIKGTETPIETVEGNYTIYYVDKADQYLTDETVTLHVPVAPVIEGFTFVEWRVAEGSLSFGITIQAIYEANEPTSAPEVYTNPANPAQKLIRNGNVYILTDDKIYSITGQEVIVP